MDSQGVSDPELQRFIELQSQQAQLAAQAMQFADLCWEKCVEKPGNKTIGNGSDSKVDSCLQNCVERFLDSTEFILRRLESKAGPN
jgi:mitochondrial import inner membrane translocase subunit TIM8